MHRLRSRRNLEITPRPRALDSLLSHPLFLSALAPKGGILSFLARITALSAIVLTAYGQSSVEIPATTDPGRVEQHIEVPEHPPKVPKAEVPKPTPLVAPPAAEAIRFVLHKLFFEGVSVYREEELGLLYQELLNREVSLRDIYGVADRLIDKYRADGYALQTAVVPKQNFNSGVVGIWVVEGFVDKVIVNGDLSEDDARLLHSYTDKIIADRPLRRKTLERYLLLANEIPGLRVEGQLRRAERPGAVDLVLNTTRKRLEFSSAFDNYGSEPLGPEQFQLGAIYHDLFRLGDSTRFSVGGTPGFDKLRYYLLRHSQVVGSEGLTLEAQGGYIETHPDLDLAGELEGQAILFNLRARYPLIRSFDRSLYLTGAFDFLNSENAFEARTITSDRIRALRLSTSYLARDQWNGESFIDITLSQGLDILGANASSPSAGRTDFTKLNVSASRRQRVWGNLSAVWSVTGQAAISSLLSSEKFGYGGRRFGRAFDPSEITGDHGLATALELRYGSPIGLFGGALSEYELFTYGDWGQVWQRDSGLRRKTESGASVGGGLRLGVGRYFTVTLEFAQQVDRPTVRVRDEDWRLFFSVNARNR